MAAAIHDWARAAYPLTALPPKRFVAQLRDLVTVERDTQVVEPVGIVTGPGEGRLCGTCRCVEELGDAVIIDRRGGITPTNRRVRCRRRRQVVDADWADDTVHLSA